LTGCPTGEEADQKPELRLVVKQIHLIAIILKTRLQCHQLLMLLWLFLITGVLQKNNTEGSDVDISSGEATIPFTVKMAKSGAADPQRAGADNRNL
jgi:hypothetical protein